MVELDGVSCLTPAEKHSLLRSTAIEHDLSTFVETGTYHGDTVAAMLADPPVVSRVYTIELSPELHDAAVMRFATDYGVYLRRGSSAVLMPEIMARIGKASLFWLDAHPGYEDGAGVYGDVPLLAELRAIVTSPLRHIILIDDARYMGKEHGWPTLDEIRHLAPGWDVRVADDIVWVTRP